MCVGDRERRKRHGLQFKSGGQKQVGLLYADVSWRSMSMTSPPPHSKQPLFFQCAASLGAGQFQKSDAETQIFVNFKMYVKLKIIIAKLL